MYGGFSSGGLRLIHLLCIFPIFRLYSVSIFCKIGVPAFEISVAVGVVYFLSTLIGIFTVDKVQYAWGTFRIIFQSVVLCIKGSVYDQSVKSSERGWMNQPLLDFKVSNAMWWNHDHSYWWYERIYMYMQIYHYVRLLSLTPSNSFQALDKAVENWINIWLYEQCACMVASCQNPLGYVPIHHRCSVTAHLECIFHSC